MCGFAGVVDFTGREVPMSLFRRMRDTLAHRGPDAAQTLDVRSPGRMTGALGFCRLSIIDLSPLGNQPMSASGEGPHLVFNGEIYNHRDLRRALETRGTRFQSRADSEVLMRLLQIEGEAALPLLLGMFAFAWVDPIRGRVLLARDRVGKKPLYYRFRDGRLAFASELKALLADPETPREIDAEALDHYLRYQYIPSPLSILTGVRKVRPGHLLIAQASGYQEKQYWHLDYATKQRLDTSEAVARTKDLVEQAVVARLESDVPLGAFLSGGIDSSIVTSVMARHLSQPVKTFCIGFEESAYDERDAARVIARRVGAEHHELVVRIDARATLPQLAWHYDEPFGDSSALPTFHVARLTREHVTVALSGDGGDESFAGYERYAAGVAAERIRGMLPAAVLRAVGDLVLGSHDAASRSRRRALQRFWEGLLQPDPARRYVGWMLVGREQELRELYREPYRPSEDAARYLESVYDGGDEALATLDRMQRLDVLTYLPDDLLVKMDRASMANSLEVRAPLLDHRVMEFAASLAPDLRLRRLRLKWLLKKAFHSDLPRTIRRRRKRGFGVPIARWFRGDLGREFELHVLARDSRSRHFFRPEAVRTLLDDHRAGRRDHAPLLWSLLMLEHWHRVHLG